MIIDEVYRVWEPKVTPIKDLKHTYDYAVVLTGVASTDARPRDRVYFGKGADRVTHSLQLFKLGKVRNILISGGSGKVLGEKVSEAIILKSFYRMCGVPDSCILLEPTSVNTHENAKFTADLIRKTNPKASLLLVTSASHMRRAKGCFDKEGLKTTTFTVDFSAGARRATPDWWLLPSELALIKWANFIHEFIGFIMYKLVGYI